MRTKKRHGATFTSIEIAVFSCDRASGNVKVSIEANPTRTLAHLLSQHGEYRGFLRRIERLSIEEFFARSQRGVPRSLDGNDNWIADPVAAHSRLGSDPFSRFLPVFCSKVGSLVEHLIGPTAHSVREDDDASLMLANPATAVRITQSDIKAPQVETYFERHHSQAMATAQSAAVAAIISVDDAGASRYSNYRSDWVERVQDSIVVSAPLDETNRRLTVYAKDQRRLRIEVKRLGSGDYSSLSRTAPPWRRLQEILELEREQLLGSARWERVGRLLDEPDIPSLGDFVRFCSLVSDACGNDGTIISAALSRLVKTGGLPRGGTPSVPSSVVAALEARGVIGRAPIRKRDRDRPMQRLHLQGEFRELVNIITASLVDLERED